MSALLDAEDDLVRLRALLGLLQMAAGDLIKEQSRAMSWGLERAEEMTADLADRLAAIRAGSTGSS